MKTVRTIKTTVALFIVLSIDASLQASTIRYASPTGDDSKSGLTSDEAKTFYGVMSGVQNGDEIRYLKGTYTVDVQQSSTPNTGAIVLGGPVTFRGWDGENDRPAKRGEVTIDFGSTGPGYYSLRGISFYDMTILNGKGVTYGGGGICLNSNPSYYGEIPVVSNCIFRGCTATTKSGGALYVARPATVIDCLFEKNDNTSGGAALYASEGAEIVRCTFLNNKTTNEGGAIYSLGAVFTDCAISNNVSGKAGGAIYGTVALAKNCIIVSNCTSDCGGAVAWNSAARQVFTGCLISNNVSLANGNWGCGGGGFFCQTAYGLLTLTNCTIACNYSKVSGGGIMMRYGADLTLHNVRFFGNFANATLSTGALAQNAAGAAIWFVNANNGTNTFVDCTFDGNRYRSDFTVSGGSINSDASVAYLSGCTFKNGDGKASAAEYALSAAIDMSRCHFLCNTNTASGALFTGKSGIVSNCTVRNNCSIGSRAGIVLSGGNGTTNVYSDCIFENNYSGGSAAGIIVVSAGMFKIEDCVFRTNAWAGAFSSYAAGNVACLQLVNATDYAGISFERCIFEGNTNAVAGGTGNNGGAIGFIASKNATAANILEGTHVRDSLFVRNFGPTHANRKASAIYLSTNSNGIAIENCTFIAHPDKPPVQYETNPTVPKIVNSAFAGNTYDVTAELMTHSWQGALADAKLIAPEAGNFGPKRDSPLVNIGAFAEWMSGATDLAGKPRVHGATVDIGCYEYRPDVISTLFYCR